LKKVSSLVVLMIIQLLTSAQVKVAILEDDPNAIKPFRFRIPLWIINPASYNFSAYDARLGMDWRATRKLLIAADYSIGLFDRLLPESESGSEYPSNPFMLSQKEDTKSNYFSFELTYNFSEKTSVESMAVNLGSRGNIQYYTTVPGNVYKALGLHAGLKKGVTWYHFGDVPIQYGGAEESRFGDYFVDRSTYLTYTQLRIGLAYQKVTNLHIEAQGYGKGSDAGIVQYHIDLLPTLSAEVDDVYYVERNINNGDPNGYTYFPVQINEPNEKSKMGFELGVKFIPTMSSFAYHANLGRVPGFKGGPNGYLELGVSISIGKKLKPTGNTGKTFESTERKKGKPEREPSF
jgi:hypothetical protein